MAAISVASLGFDHATSVFGQSFTPNVPGPDGAGSIGSATAASLLHVTFSFADPLSSANSGKVFIYESLLDDPNDCYEGVGALARSITYTDGSAFGSGTYTRTFNFTQTTLQVGHTYYIYLPEQDSVQYLDASAYSGGQGINADGEVGDFSLSFRVDLNV